MDNEMILDCIIVATSPPPGDTSSSDDNVSGVDAHPAAQEAQETDSDETYEPTPPPQALSPKAQSNQSPKKKREVEVKPEAQGRPQVRSGLRGEHAGGQDCGEHPTKISDAVSGIAALQLSRDINFESTGSLQDTTLSRNHLTTHASAATMVNTKISTKRPRGSSSSPADERPQKQPCHMPVDRSGAREHPESKSIRQKSSVPKLRIKIRGRQSQQGKTAPVINVRKDGSEERQYSSSDEPLVARRRRQKNTAPKKVPPSQPADDSDDMPMVSSARRSMRTKRLPSSVLQSDKPSGQLNDDQHRDSTVARTGAQFKIDNDDHHQQWQTQHDELQPSQTIQDLKDQLAEAKQDNDTYMQSLKKERAKNHDLEEQRLLWEAKKLIVREEDEVVDSRLRAQLRASESARTKLIEEIKEHISSKSRLRDDISKHEHKAQEAEEKMEAAYRQSQSEVEGLRNQVNHLQAALSEERSKRPPLEMLLGRQRQELSERRDKEAAMQKQISELLDFQKQTENEFQSKLNSSVASRTEKLATELGQRQTTIEQTNQKVEDLQEELDWYKNQLEKERKRFRTEWDIRDQEVRKLLRML